MESVQGIYDLPLQSLVALISLAVLNLPLALEMVLQNSTSALSIAASQNDAPYLLNLDGIEQAKTIFLNAADAGLANASLAVLAWSVIFQTVRDCVIACREAKETRLGLRVSDKYGAVESSDTDGIERPPVRSSPSTSSDISQPSSFLEELLDRILDTVLNEDSISYLAKSAVDRSRVFDVVTALATDYSSIFGSDHNGKPGLLVRRMLLELIRAVLEWIEYQPILLIATLAALNGNERYWDTIDRPQELKHSEPSAFFLNDYSLMQKLFRTALARFPYETLPFLQFCRALAISGTTDDEGQPTIFVLLQSIDSLTCTLSPKFTKYEIIREDEDANYIQLTDTMNILDTVDCSLNFDKSNQVSGVSPKIARSIDSLELPRGTMGRVLSENKPLVVMWRYDYSVLSYIGKILQYASVDRSSSSGSMASIGSREVVTEIIDLLTIIISSTYKTNADVQDLSVSQGVAQTILENASDGLDRNQDVVSVIFEIFENELLGRQSASDEKGSLNILIRCIQFTHALLPVMPDRVWPFLGRSSLLGINGVDSQIGAIITSAERISGHYNFLYGCIRVYDALIDDAIAHAISRKAPMTAVRRFAAKEKLGSRISQTLSEKIIAGFQRTMVDVFESLPAWKFSSQAEKWEINASICSIFSKILSYTFDVNGLTDMGQKLTKPLSSAAQYILEVFLPSSSTNISVHPLLQILLEGVAIPNNTLSIKELQYCTCQVVNSIDLITELIQVNTLFGKPPTSLEEQIFKATPVLAKLYAVHEKYRLSIINLFSALISGHDNADSQPPSLLSHLGQDTASCFLETLSVLDQPLSDNNLSIGIWQLLSAIVSRRQQWLAIFVLTGNTPRNTLKDNKKLEIPKPQQAEPLLAAALDELSNIERLEPMNAIAMLEFVALAADYWPWVLSSIEEHPHFLTAIKEFIVFSEPRLASNNERIKRVANDYIRLQISSVLMNILAMYIHHTCQKGNSLYAVNFLPNLSFLAQTAVYVPSYNASLHGNLRRNFESKFPGCALVEFKRTSTRKPQLGPSFYYELDMASRMLSFDAAWAGRRGQGFAEEMIRANINLSLVDSQIVSMQNSYLC